MPLHMNMKRHPWTTHMHGHRHPCMRIRTRCAVRAGLAREKTRRLGYYMAAAVATTTSKATQNRLQEQEQEQVHHALWQVQKQVRERQCRQGSRYNVHRVAAPPRPPQPQQAGSRHSPNAAAGRRVEQHTPGARNNTSQHTRHNATPPGVNIHRCHTSASTRIQIHGHRQRIQVWRPSM